MLAAGIVSDAGTVEEEAVSGDDEASSSESVRLVHRVLRIPPDA